MSRIAADLRRETLAAARGLSPLERIELALRLGDSDIALYRAATGATAEEARAVFEQARRAGRQSVRSASGA